MTLLELQKMAEAVKEELKKPHPAAILGKSILGLGVGTGIGYGVGKGIDHLIGKGGLPMSTAAKFLPLVGGAAGLATPYFFQGTNQRMHEAHAERQHERARQ